VVVGLAVLAESVDQAASVELVDRADRVELVVSADRVELADRVDRAALVELAASVGLAVSAELVDRVALEELAGPAAENGNTIRVIAEMRRTAIAELQINLVKPIIVPALVRALIVLAALVLELDRRLDLQAEVVPAAVAQRVARVVVQDHRPGHPVVAVQTESVITRRRARVMETAAADLAEAAEIMRAPAVPAADAAWAEADSVAVAAVVGSVVAVAAAADVEVAVAAAEDVGVKNSMRRNQMKTETTIMTSSKLFMICGAIVGCAILILTTDAAEKKQTTAAASVPNQEASGGQQKQFESADQAADALIQAAGNWDIAQLKEILGPDSDNIVSSEDPVMDKNRAAAFANKAKEKKLVEIDKKDANRAILSVGNDSFPLAIPIVKSKGKWTFDAKIGREEILNRRVGANELNAIELCRGYVEAQHEYAADKHDDSKVNQYAQRILSTPGKHDGLAWQNPDGTWGGPVGDEVAKALQEGYSAEGGKPYHGYYFKVLKGQGPAAPMGEMDFVIEGAMIGGFALAAAPAEYRVTGVETFMVGPDGIVYQKDLGPDTLKTFQSMDRYNPDKTWQETDDDVEDDSAN
jgi:Protein of unknown function (DUF2950)